VVASNFGLLYEQMAAAAYTAHPYQWPVIGWMVDIENWNMQDLKRHFEIGYSPANATMVVTGDVSADEVFRLAQEYIEPIPSRGLPPPVTTKEPQQTGERRVTLSKFAQLPILITAWHVPESANPDYYALQIMQTLLFEGESSRMYRRLVDKDQLATSIRGSYDFAIDPTLFEITAQPRDGVPTERVEKTIYEELDRLKSALVSDQELEKAKNIQLADFYRQMKTINGKANAPPQTITAKSPRKTSNAWPQNTSPRRTARSLRSSRRNNHEDAAAGCLILNPADNARGVHNTSPVPVCRRNVEAASIHESPTPERDDTAADGTA
jgi:zinc protease